MHRACAEHIAAAGAGARAIRERQVKGCARQARACGRARGLVHARPSPRRRSADSRGRTRRAHRPMLRYEREDELVLVGGPVGLLELRRQVVDPPLAALLVLAAGHVLRYRRPRLRSTLRNGGRQLLVLDVRPWPSDELWLPRVLLLGLTALVQARRRDRSRVAQSRREHDDGLLRPRLQLRVRHPRLLRLRLRLRLLLLLLLLLLRAPELRCHVDKRDS